MISGNTVLAIIPARAGSRRTPLKNLSLFKIGAEQNSLIGWALEHASQSKYIDTTVIVSDDPAALRYATPPVLALPEPPHLAAASTPMEAVLVYTLYSLTTLGEPCLPFHDLFVLLQPTSPLRTSADIDACLELASARNCRVISTNPHRRRNGAVYVSATQQFLADLNLDRAEPYLMPTERSLDIDYPQDFTHQNT